MTLYRYCSYPGERPTITVNCHTIIDFWKQFNMKTVSMVVLNIKRSTFGEKFPNALMSVDIGVRRKWDVWVVIIIQHVPSLPRSLRASYIIIRITGFRLFLAILQPKTTMDERNELLVFVFSASCSIQNGQVAFFIKGHLEWRKGCFIFICHSDSIADE